MRDGFTLIEMLIFMVIIGLASVLMVQSYQNSKDRLKFHLAAAEIQGAFDVARSSAQDGSVNVGMDRIVLLNYTENKVISFVDVDGDDEFTDGDVLLKEINLDGNDIILNDAKAMTDASSPWVEVGAPTSIIVKYFSPGFKCGFEPITTDTTDEEYMLEIPLYKVGQDYPTRYIYLHKVSCIAELLVNPLSE